MSTKPIKQSIFGKKVFLGLSGGVDSAVSAAILKEKGYDVTGVFIKVWTPDFLPCTWRDERRDAMRVAAYLGIPFLFLDFSAEYKKGVADYMIAEYALGRTPNPDVMCNREIKFGAFWNKAKELGADYIATGHYALTDGISLHEGKDKEKDQSYFLWMLKQKDLEHTLFPLGDMLKSEVRDIAKKLKLPVANKKDSQGICFIGNVSLDEFLGEFIKAETGKVLNTEGESIGNHRGANYYTIGQRHGFDITVKNSYQAPHYVIAKDIKRNTLTVSNSPAEIKAHSAEKISLRDINWISEPTPVAYARIRYRQPKFSVKINNNEVILTEKQAISPGQSIVFYTDNICLGGGIIDRVLL